MLDLNFIGDGTLPVPAPVGAALEVIGHNSAPPVLSTIRAKAEQIVSLLTGIGGCRPDDHNLSLAEELAQDIVELCPDRSGRASSISAAPLI